MNTLPPFPVDEETLGLLSGSLDPDPVTGCSTVGSFLAFFSQMGGGDPDAVMRLDNGIEVMRDQGYHEHDVIRALIAEVRRLRARS